MTDALEGVLAVGNGWTQTMSEQQILDCNTWSSGCQGGTQRLLSLQCSCDMTSVKDVSSRDRPTQQQPPHKQTRKQELAL